jgi:hypothetical protein
MSNSLKFCLSRKEAVPPNGFRCICPMTDIMVRAADFGELVKECTKTIMSLGLVPPADLVREVENAICNELPGYKFCKPCSQVKQTLGFGAITRWVTAMYKFAKEAKFSLVEQEEAERRAKICASCPHQIEAAGCWGCKGIAGMLPHIAGARKTSFDPQLKACGICGCYNSVSVHLPVSVQGGENLEFPDWCWKKKV